MMGSIISRPFLQFDSEKNIWYSDKSKTFYYSDGNKIEKYIKECILKCKDVNNNSEGLKSYIKDWPTEYHFSSLRNNLFSLFDCDSKARVLEIGCGCGSITRYLGETFDEVVSIEGSLNRAEIAALRTNDLPSVKVVASQFQELKFKKKFDLIFCVGVIEYFPMVMNSQNPFDTLFDQLKSLLSDQGSLVIAIENQFGLKYLGGAPEDHVNIKYEGINGYPNTSKKVRTFGRKDLECRLKKSNFDTVNFYFPFPDYKMPRLVISEEIINSNSEYNFGELISKFSNESSYFKHKFNFNQLLVWTEAAKNKLIPDLSNSFLVVANVSDCSKYIKNKYDIVFFSSCNRSINTRTKTTVSKENNSKLVVKKEVLGSNSYSPLLNLSKKMDWQNGESLALKWYRKIKDCSIDDFVKDVIKWLLFVDTSALLSPNVISGDKIDCTPWNIIETKQGLALIDHEWEWPNDISIKYLYCRGMLYFFGDYECSFNRIFSGKFNTFQGLIVTIGKHVFSDFSIKDIDEFIKLESLFLSQVTNKSEKDHRHTIKKSLKKKRKKFFDRYI